ncbi:MAG: hypothetical protein U1E02_30860, partial [Hydrogenophaga sp.]|nr:hypothetical protein [Hydrogenophaga sp.]
GTLTVRSGGSVWIKGLASGGDILITAGGSVTLGDRAALGAGRVDSTVEADTLSVVAGGAIAIYEADSLQISELRSTTGAAVTVRAGGNLTLDGAVSASNQAVSLSSAGVLALNAAVSTGGAALSLTAANGLILSDAADLSSAGGRLALDAGSGMLAMHSDTVVDAGAGQISLKAAQAVTLGQLRSSNTGVLLIDAGGLSARADGVPDIVAANATLRIVSTGGIGAAANPLETQVKNMDLFNSNLGAIVVEEADALGLQSVQQQAGSVIDIRTQSGAISVFSPGEGGSGISATTGNVSLYAGGASVSLGADVSTIGGGVQMVAEQGNITLAAGIRVAGSGDIALNAAAGNILVASSAAQWLTNSAGFDPAAQWALANGRYVVNQVTGEIKAAKLSAAETTQYKIANDQVLRAAGGAYLQTTGGGITLLAQGDIGKATNGSPYSPLAMYLDAISLRASSAIKGEVAILATGSISVGATVPGGAGSSGGATNVISLSGIQKFDAPVDAAGQDITIAANQVNISETIRSADATLTIRPLDPSVAIVLGDLLSQHSSGETLSLNRDSLSNIGA